MSSHGGCDCYTNNPLGSEVFIINECSVVEASSWHSDGSATGQALRNQSQEYSGFLY